MKTFRIVKINNKNTLQYKVEQRHTILFIFHYWDTGASDLCPTYLFNSQEDALKAIANCVTITS